MDAVLQLVSLQGVAMKRADEIMTFISKWSPPRDAGNAPAARFLAGMLGCPM